MAGCVWTTWPEMTHFTQVLLHKLASNHTNEAGGGRVGYGFYEHGLSGSCQEKGNDDKPNMYTARISI
jgi:hypothetical protein